MFSYKEAAVRHGGTYESVRVIAGGEDDNQGTECVHNVHQTGAQHPDHEHEKISIQIKME